ncbi:hypothetical protein Tco_0222597 [Tanacetum coccineum]
MKWRSDKLTSSTSAQLSRRFTIAEIQSITNNFDDELVIGQGGFERESFAVDRDIEEEQGSLARWAQKCVKEKRFDQMVDSNITGTIAPKCLRGFAEIENRCLIRDFEKRPSMTQGLCQTTGLLELTGNAINLQIRPGLHRESNG